jgi:hypothetical protein
MERARVAAVLNPLCCVLPSAVSALLLTLSLPLPAQVALDHTAAVIARADSSCAWVGAPTVARHDSMVASLRAMVPGPDRMQWQRALLCMRYRHHAAGTFAHMVADLEPGVGWHRTIQLEAGDILSAIPTDTTALTLLGALGIELGKNQRFGGVELPDEIADVSLRLDYDAALPSLVYGVRLGVDDPFVYRACVSLAIVAGDFGSARDCAMRALDAGHDNAWHHMRLAALGAWTVDTTRGTMHFVEAFRYADATEQAREEVLWHLEREAQACAACLVNGMLTVGGAGVDDSLVVKNRLTLTARASSRSLSGDALLGWIRAAIAARDSARVARYGPYRFQVPTAEYYQAIWDGGGLFTRRVFAHFHLTAYRRGAFRSCRLFLPQAPPPCTPRMQPLRDNYVDAGLIIREVWDPAVGQPVSLAAWALAAEGFSANPDHAAAQLEWRGWEPVTGTQWHQVVRLSVPSNRWGGGWVMGTRRLPADSSPTVAMVVAQGAARRGAAFVDERTPLGTGPLELSDPLLGQHGTGATTVLGADTVFIAPLATFARKAPVTLFFQTRSATAHENHRLRMRFLEGDGPGASGRELLTITAAIDVPAGLSGHHRELQVPDLSPGRYRLEIASLDAGGDVVTHRSAGLEVVK